MVKIRVYDFANSGGDDPKAIDLNVKEKSLSVLKDEVRKVIRKSGKRGSKMDFFICTSDREVITEKNCDLIEDGDTFMILSDMEQELPMQFMKKINFEPHYDTLIKSGMYEYYASDGKQPLPFAFAELVDNSLGATSANQGKRLIDLMLCLDDTNPQNSVILVTDNGCGMTTEDITNWAKYKYSKFVRKERFVRKTRSSGGGDDSPSAPRFLNSQISYFGAGGKQAVFYIGSCVRIITKSKKSKDVHEFSLSQEEFQRKEQTGESIFVENIRSRRIGDCSHITGNTSADQILKQMIQGEKGKDSFTCVAISNVHPHHVRHLKEAFKQHTQQLAHIYHYYIHGPNGNVERENAKSVDNNLDIVVKYYDVNSRKNQCVNFAEPKLWYNLRDVEDDMQTLYVRSAVATYEFRAVVDNVKTVEGIIRYHPFLYDRETYPQNPYKNEDEESSQQQDSEKDMDEGKTPKERPIFECYWNGRLIPDTTVNTLDWCAPPKRQSLSKAPIECYSRISGVLFTDSKFEVTQNKQTFQDSLAEKLRSPSTAFTHFTGSQQRRQNNELFTKWLVDCHEKYDKQIKFLNFQGLLSRTELAKNRQYPWTVFDSIEWEGKVYRKGNLAKTIKTIPIVVGKITRFFLFGDHQEDTYGTSGYFELKQEPAKLYNDALKTYPVSKLDITATEAQIEQMIAGEEGKLPHALTIQFPKGNEVSENCTIKAGTEVGPIMVDIVDKDGTSVGGRLPGSAKKPLLVYLTLCRDSEQVCSFSAPNAKWNYWFKVIKHCRVVGNYTLKFMAGLATETTSSGDLTLPSAEIKFKVKEAEPAQIAIKNTIGPQRIGCPFNILLTLKDAFNNEVISVEDYPIVLSSHSKSLSLTSEGLHNVNNSVTIKKVVALGKLPSEKGKEDTIEIKGGNCKAVSTKVRFKAGKPAKLEVFPEDNPMLEIENGTLPRFGALIYDTSGNLVTHLVEEDLQVTCKFFKNIADGEEALPGIYKLDFVTGPDGKECCLKGTPAAIHLKNLAEGNKEIITARLSVKDHKVPYVERKIKVVASCKPSVIKLFCSSEFDESIAVEIPSVMEWTAGSVIKNILYKIYDDAGNEVRKPNISQSNLKISWASYNELSKCDVKNGHLPDIKVSLSTEQQHSFNVNLIFADMGVTATLGQQQSYVAFDFTVNPRPGNQSQLRVTLPSYTKIPAGETLKSDIEVKIADKYCNGVCGITELDCCKLKLKCDGAEIDESSVKKVLGEKEGVLLIKDLKFVDKNLGMRRILLQYEDLKETITLESVPGQPKKMVWEFNVECNKQTITVCKNAMLSISVQLFDEYGNKCPIGHLPVCLGIDNKLTIQPGPHTVETDVTGKAYFGRKVVSVNQEEKPISCPLNSCPTKCYGTFNIQSKSCYEGKNLFSPVVKVHVLCDKSRAEKFKIGHSDELKTVAGGSFPYFSVSMLAEDESVVMDATVGQLNMLLTNVAAKEQRTFGATGYENGNYVFDIPEAPHAAGRYTIQFFFADGSERALNSEILPFDVTCGPPARIAPTNFNGGKPYVSNTSSLNSRIIVKHLVFVVMDEYGNHLQPESDESKELDGVITVDIIGLNEQTMEQTPLFTDKKATASFAITKGKAVVTSVVLEEKTTGVDGGEYALRFRAKLENETGLKDFDIPFVFINDAQKQFEMIELDKKKNELTTVVKEKKDKIVERKTFYRQLIDELNSAKSEEQQAFNALIRDVGYSPSSKDSFTSVEQVEEKHKTQVQLLANLEKQEAVQPFRECQLVSAPNEPGVVGKIGHLALVSDPTEAFVLSWHMQGDLDCIVTHNSSKAKELNDRFRGSQQLLPVDNIFKKNLPAEWNGPLPHQRARSVPTSFRPTGRPVYARCLLKFTKDPEICRIVFGMLLGETLIMDTIDDALNYREELVKHTQCPTILTRTGDRLRNNGKFGGLSNRAPQSAAQLRNGYFGLAPSEKLLRVKREVELLMVLKEACTKRIEADAAVEVHQSSVMEDVQKLETDLHELEKQIRECEERKRELSQGRRHNGGHPRRSYHNDSNESSHRLKRNPPSSTASLHGNEYDKRRR